MREGRGGGYEAPVEKSTGTPRGHFRFHGRPAQRIAAGEAFDVALLTSDGRRFAEKRQL